MKKRDTVILERSATYRHSGTERNIPSFWNGAQHTVILNGAQHTVILNGAQRSEESKASAHKVASSVTQECPKAGIWKCMNSEAKEL